LVLPGVYTNLIETDSTVTEMSVVVLKHNLGKGKTLMLQQFTNTDTIKIAQTIQCSTKNVGHAKFKMRVS